MAKSIHALIARPGINVCQDCCLVCDASRRGYPVAELILHDTGIDGLLTARLIITSSTARQGMPVVTATERTTSVVGGSSSRRLSRALAVGAAEEASKDGSQTGKTTSNDADVEFQACPDGNVSRVPEPVT